MKKLVIFVAFITCLFSVSCTRKNGTTQLTNSGQHTEITQIETNETTSASNLLIQSDNIQELDLSLTENDVYLKYKKTFSYNNEYILPNGKKIIEDKNLYIEDLSGNRELLIEVSEEETEKYVVFWDIIDNDRFCYYIVNHETTDGSGIYNTKTGEDFRICACKDHSAYVPKIIADNYLYFTRGFINTFKGFGKLNLETYEFIEIDCYPLLDNNIYYWGEPDISPDGTKAAVYRVVSKASKPNEINEYQVAIYSLSEEKILKTYDFVSENDYINQQLVYYSENQVYLYASQYGNDPKDFLYIINIQDL